MTPPRRIFILLALAIVVAGATAALAVGGAAPPPKKAWVTSHGLRAGTVLGSYCSSGTSKDGGGVSGCGEAAYPLHPRSYLPITRGSTVRANLRHRAKTVVASLLRVEGHKTNDVTGSVEAKPVGSHRRVWRLHLPAELGGANVISIEARFKPSGDANFWAGVRPVAAWP
jgi:hypothetical protein